MGDPTALLNGGSTRATHTVLLCRASLGSAMARQRAMASSAGKIRGARAMAEGSTSSSSSSSPPTSEKASELASSAVPSPYSSSPPVGCTACGRAELESGCNGEGRIQGGIGAIPGFDWWPAKAYRPCPAFLKSGGRYRRSGQSLNEIAFGRKGSGDDMDVSERRKR